MSDDILLASQHHSALVYSDEYTAYDFGKDHPLQPIRLQLTYELIEAYHLLDKPWVQVVAPRMATDEELTLAHTSAYIDKVRELSQSDIHFEVFDAPFGLGTPDNPIFPGMHQASALAAGGSIVACEQVMTGKSAHAFNMAGGLHHAHPGYASGFCIYNDAAVAIANIRKKFGARVLYIDFDAHHGDGVQDVFYGDADVLTVSFHESGNYLFPGTGDCSDAGHGAGYGYSINLPFELLTSDPVFLEAYDELIPSVAEAFRPDLIVTQMGCDPYWNDPLAHLLITMKGFQTLYRKTHELAHKVCNGRWVAVGGGGYTVHTIVPRAWTMLFAEMSGVELSNDLPEEWVARCRQYDDGHEPVGIHLIDDRAPAINPKRIASTRAAAMDSIAYIKQFILPLIHRDVVY